MCSNRRFASVLALALSGLFLATSAQAASYQFRVPSRDLRSGALPAGFISYGGLTWAPRGSTKYDWGAANAYCTTSTLNGATGWRLPTEAELTALGIWADGTTRLTGAGWTIAGLGWTSNPDTPGTHRVVQLSPVMNGGAVDGYAISITCVR